MFAFTIMQVLEEGERVFYRGLLGTYQSEKTILCSYEKMSGQDF